jgi:putative NADH-flavin reductase
LKLTIFGATGRTGRHVLEQALTEGHQVTVLVRDPARLAVSGAGVRCHQGNVLDDAAVHEAISGSQAVISVLGPTSNQPAFEVTRGTELIIAAMLARGVRRLIVSTGAGVRDPQDRPTPMHAFFGALVRLLSPNVVKDMEQAMTRVRASDLDWTIVRAPMLTDGPRTGLVWSGPVGSHLGPRLSRADFAAFILSQLRDERYMRQAPAVCNVRAQN